MLKVDKEIEEKIENNVNNNKKETPSQCLAANEKYEQYRGADVEYCSRLGKDVDSLDNYIATIIKLIDSGVEIQRVRVRQVPQPRNRMVCYHMNMILICLIYALMSFSC